MGCKEMKHLADASRSISDQRYGNLGNTIAQRAKEMRNAEKGGRNGVRFAKESIHQISAVANQLLVGDGMHETSTEGNPLCYGYYVRGSRAKGVITPDDGTDS
jgi:hypothetical protein